MNINWNMRKLYNFVILIQLVLNGDNVDKERRILDELIIDLPFLII